MFDFYGSGQSEAPAVLCDFSLYAETTIELIEKLGFSKPFTLWYLFFSFFYIFI
jgi:hypothetical protein